MNQATELASSKCHCINLRRAANAITDYYDRAFARDGVTLNQYSLLSNIRKIQPCSVAELARQVRLERTTLVRNLKTLYNAGWIENDAARGSRKSKTHLTEAGMALLETAQIHWMQAQADVEGCLGPDGIRKLTDYLLALEKLNWTDKK